jgi:hypothetical protein
VLPPPLRQWDNDAHSTFYQQNLVERHNLAFAHSRLEAPQPAHTVEQLDSVKYQPRHSPVQWGPRRDIDLRVFLLTRCGRCRRRWEGSAVCASEFGREDGGRGGQQ